MTRYCCNLCGLAIQRGRRSRGKPWLSDFRAVISSLEVEAHGFGFMRINKPTTSIGDVTLTGVGLSARDMGPHFTFDAPRDSNARWNDAGYNDAQRQQFGVDFRSRNGCHGVLFHDSCWSVLERAFQPESVPLDRLYDLCLSMPEVPHEHLINWGHDYGGLFRQMDRPCCPWDVIEHPGIYGINDRYEPDFDGDEWTEPDFRTLALTCDPYNLDEIRMIVQKRPQRPPERIVACFSSVSTTDSFSRLPSEIRSEIASYLPTSDFLNARLVLRGLCDIFDSQLFWATRFSEPGERSWVFESLEPRDTSLDWRFLYKVTSDARVAQAGGIQNRQRVWNLAMRLRNTLSLRPLVPLPPVKLAETEIVKAKWIEAGADKSFPDADLPHQNFNRGCTIRRRQNILLEPRRTLKSIALSFVEVAEDSYLSGLRFDFQDGQDLQIGYRARTEQLFEFDSGILTGFRLAISPRGIQGIQFVTDGSSCSQWYGRSDRLPHTNRLVSSEPLTSLDFGLDACKVVSITASRGLRLPGTTIAEVPEHQERDELKQGGLWFPAIPPPSVDLNQRSFPEALRFTSKFQPLLWCHFGGPEGVYLRHLIALKFHFLDKLFRIDFKYDSPNVPESCFSLGRHQCGKRACRRGHLFSIDGPGGELIASVTVTHLKHSSAFSDDDDIFVGNYHRDNSVVDIKIETNRGRSFRLNNEQGLRKLVRYTGATISRSLNVTGKTIITGLYARQSHKVKSDFTTLGVISESS